MSENIIVAPADPVLGPADLFRADDCPEEINLGIGVYKGETGETPILTSVKKAEQYLLENETTKSYLGIDGTPEFSCCTQKLLFGRSSTIIADKRARIAQIPGGTDALRIAADFLAKNTDMKRAWVSNPSWPDHESVFTSVGLGVHEYTYHDTTNHALGFEGLLASLTEAQAGDAVLFHGCCHSPAGIDPTLDQWQQLTWLSVEKSWLPPFDSVYQDSAHGLEEDAEGLYASATLYRELLVVGSYLKNFGLYNERVGACTLVAADQETVNHASSWMKSVIRVNYSNSPTYGASVVATILSNDVLRAIWEQELTDIRQRIQRACLLLVNTLQEKDTNRNFSFTSQQSGMFSFSGLTKEQVLCLCEKFVIYTVAFGRINMTEMTPDNMVPLCEAIVAVL